MDYREEIINRIELIRSEWILSQIYKFIINITK